MAGREFQFFRFLRPPPAPSEQLSFLSASPRFVTHSDTPQATGRIRPAGRLQNDSGSVTEDPGMQSLSGEYNLVANNIPLTNVTSELPFRTSGVVGNSGELQGTHYPRAPRYGGFALAASAERNVYISWLFILLLYFSSYCCFGRYSFNF